MKARFVFKSLLGIVTAASFLYGAEETKDPQGGALTLERSRVIVSSDIGGGDEDDIQSMIHYLVYADLFDTEGLISSPPQQGRKKDILKVIDQYEKDYTHLKTWTPKYPTPDTLRSFTKQGATDGLSNARRKKTFVRFMSWSGVPLPMWRRPCMMILPSKRRSAFISSLPGTWLRIGIPSTTSINISRIPG